MHSDWRNEISTLCKLRQCFWFIRHKRYHEACFSKVSSPNQSILFGKLVVLLHNFQNHSNKTALDSRETGPLGDICHFKKDRTRLRILRELSSLIIYCFLIQSSYSLEFITISQSLTLPLDKVTPLFGRQFDSLRTSCLRIILGVSRTDHVSNGEVYDRTATVSLFPIR